MSTFAPFLSILFIQLIEASELMYSFASLSAASAFPHSVFCSLNSSVAKPFSSAVPITSLSASIASSIFVFKLGSIAIVSAKSYSTLLIIPSSAPSLFSFSIFSSSYVFSFLYDIWSLTIRLTEPVLILSCLTVYVTCYEFSTIKLICF